MDELLDAARDAVASAVVPYSEYAVGAAIETADGTVFTGANIEIANYSNSLHAEEVALARAVMAGHRDFERIAVASDARDGVTPCGMCRQTLAEFADGEFEVLVDHPDGPESHRLADLLPHAFTGDQIHDHASRD
ncbi:MAG: cytidine deaminase [Halodesulfurarchaeum sp.]